MGFVNTKKSMNLESASSLSTKRNKGKWKYRFFAAARLKSVRTEDISAVLYHNECSS